MRPDAHSEASTSGRGSQSERAQSTIRRSVAAQIQSKGHSICQYRQERIFGNGGAKSAVNKNHRRTHHVGRLP